MEVHYEPFVVISTELKSKVQFLIKVCLVLTHISNITRIDNVIDG